MLNLDSFKKLEERILGTYAWLTAHGNQLDKMKTEFDQTKADISDALKQLSALKDEVASIKKGSS